MSAVYPFLSVTPFRCLSKHLFNCLSPEEQKEMRAAQRLEYFAPDPSHSEEYMRTKNRLTAVAIERYQQFLNVGYTLLKHQNIPGKELFSLKDKDQLAFLLAKEATTMTLSFSEQTIKTALLYKAYYMFCGFNLARFCLRQRSNPTPIHLSAEIDREKLFILLGKRYLNISFSEEENKLVAQEVYRLAMANYQLPSARKKSSTAKSPSMFQPHQKQETIASALIIESYTPSNMNIP